MPNHPRLLQSPERRKNVVPAGFPQILQPGGTAGALQRIQNLRPPADTPGGGFDRLRVQFRLYAPDLLKAVPKPRRQNGPNRLGQGAEIPLPHPKGQGQSVSVQYRLPVQHGGKGLQALNLLSLAPGKNHALRQFVSPAKGYGHPDAGDRRILQLRRNQIVIGFVDVIRRGTDRHFYDG